MIPRGGDCVRGVLYSARRWLRVRAIAWARRRSTRCGQEKVCSPVRLTGVQGCRLAAGLGHRGLRREAACERALSVPLCQCGTDILPPVDPQGNVMVHGRCGGRRVQQWPPGMGVALSYGVQIRSTDSGVMVA